MPTVNMFEAKSNLSRLVEAVETGAETEIIYRTERSAGGPARACWFCAVRSADRCRARRLRCSGQYRYR
jgi:hypothetical protein